MTITQRKLMSSYNRAHASDHRREQDDDTRTENRAFAFVCAWVIGLSVLKLVGVL